MLTWYNNLLYILSYCFYRRELKYKYCNKYWKKHRLALKNKLLFSQFATLFNQ